MPFPTPVSLHRLGTDPPVTLSLVGTGCIIRDRQFTSRLDESDTDQMRARAAHALKRGVDVTLYALASGKWHRRDLRPRIQALAHLVSDIAARSCFQREAIVHTGAVFGAIALPCLDVLEWPDRPVGCHDLFRLRAASGTLAWDPGPFGAHASLTLRGSTMADYARGLAAALRGEEHDLAAPYQGGLIRLSLAGSHCCITPFAAAALRDCFLNNREVL